MRSFAPALAVLSLPLFALAAYHGRHPRGHVGLAARARGDVLDKRDFSGRFTYYDITVGLTACGGSFSASDYVVALNGDQFGDVPGSSQYCGASITISYNGVTVTATIQDKCPGCPYGGLDLTEGVFKALTGGSLTAGVLQGTWSLGSGSGSGSAPKEEPTTTTPAYTPPTTSSTPEYAYDPPTTTTHYNAPSSTPHYNPPSSSHHSNSPSPTPQTSSSTPSPPPSSSSKPSSSSSSSTTSSTSAAYTSHSHSPSSPATTTSSSVLPTASSVGDPAGTIDDNGGPETIEGLYGTIVGLGEVIESCQN